MAEEHTCEDCGEEHMTLEEATAKTKQRYNLFVLGYFFSLIGLTACAYGLTNSIHGAGLVVFGFFTFLAHVNMKVTSNYLEQLEQMTQPIPNAIKDIIKPHGTYL